MGQRLREVRPKPLFRSEQIGFTGMRDSYDVQSVTERVKAYLLQNCYPQDPGVMGGLVGRPGFVPLNTTPVTGSPAIRHVDFFAQRDGTRFTVAFAGDKMYQVNWALGTLTDVTGTMTLDANAQIYTVAFANGLVISDGVGKPWWWDGATTWTELTNAPIAYGQPVVYYSKLFFINDENRVEIQWSEEQDPNLGYAVGGYNNAWELIQVNQAPLYALAATEGALYFFRDTATSVIVGAVTNEFASTGVRDAISDTVGTRSPRSVYVVGKNDIYFIDQFSRPQHIAPGGGLLNDFWVDARETTRPLLRAPQAYQESFRTTYWPWADLVLFSVGAAGIQDTLLVFDNARKDFVGVWNGFQHEALAWVEDDEGEDAIVHGSLDGHIYRWGTPDGEIWSDGFVEGAAAIVHIVDGPVLDFDIVRERHYTRLDLSLRRLGMLTGVTIQVRTPNGTQQIEIEDSSSGDGLWGISIWDDGEWASGESDFHIAVGLDAQGRWMRARLEHTGTNEKFGFHGWQAMGVLLADPPEAL